jgi:hypothetical protein
LRVRLALAGLLLLPTALYADYKESYRKAFVLLDRKNLDAKSWGEVEALLRQAIAEQPREGDEIKIYGMRFETYLPHYYLGLARFQQGDCGTALREWGLSLEQGAIKGNEKRALQQNQKTCETRTAASSPAPSPPPAPSPTPPAALAAAQSDLARVEGLSREVAAIEGDPDVQKAGGLGEPARKARDLLAAARAQVEAASKGTEAKPAEDARAAVGAAAAAFEDLKKVALQKRDEAHRRLAVTLSSPSPSPKGAQAPAELLEGAQAYFDGRYKDAVGLLERPAVKEPAPVAAQGCLLRAAARYALFLVGAEKEEPLKAAAGSDVRVCKRLGVSGPDPRVFSPRFVDFYRATN